MAKKKLEFAPVRIVDLKNPRVTDEAEFTRPGAVVNVTGSRAQVDGFHDLMKDREGIRISDVKYGEDNVGRFTIIKAIDPDKFKKAFDMIVAKEAVLRDQFAGDEAMFQSELQRQPKKGEKDPHKESRAAIFSARESLQKIKDEAKTGLLSTYTIEPITSSVLRVDGPRGVHVKGEYLADITYTAVDDSDSAKLMHALYTSAKEYLAGSGLETLDQTRQKFNDGVPVPITSKETIAGGGMGKNTALSDLVVASKTTQMSVSEPKKEGGLVKMHIYVRHPQTDLEGADREDIRQGYEEVQQDPFALLALESAIIWEKAQDKLRKTFARIGSSSPDQEAVAAR